MSAYWEESWSTPFKRKTNDVLVKLFVSALLIGVAFRLLFARSSSSHTLSLIETSVAAVVVVQNAHAPAPGVGDVNYNGKDQLSTFYGSPSPSAGKTTNIKGNSSQDEKCELFNGEWVSNPSGPSYSNETCKFIDVQQNCLKNGRMDLEYLHWRWKPHGCDLRPFDAKKFLDVMRNKSWGLIGDSILRNQAQSLMCLLSKVEEPLEVYHDNQYKSRRWHFPLHNFTVSLIWTPLLIKTEIFENDDGETTSENRLHIDTLDKKWTDQYVNFDYIIVSGGQWFLKTAIYLENNTVIGCHYCPKLNLTEVDLEYAYSRILKSLFHFVVSSEHKPVVMYRTWSPDHFEHGEWFNGGTCNRTAPYKIGEFNGKDRDRFMRKIELNEFDQAVLSDRSHLKLLDIYQLSLLRPDGHVGPYRTFHPFENDKNAKVQIDCLHWCVPGPVDAWNDLLMALTVND